MTDIDKHLKTELIAAEKKFCSAAPRVSVTKRKKLIIRLKPGLLRASKGFHPRHRWKAYFTCFILERKILNFWVAILKKISAARHHNLR